MKTFKLTDAGFEITDSVTMHAEHFEIILKCLIKRNRHRSLYAVACMERTQVRFAKYVNTLTF